MNDDITVLKRTEFDEENLCNSFSYGNVTGDLINLLDGEFKYKFYIRSIDDSVLTYRFTTELYNDSLLESFVKFFSRIVENSVNTYEIFNDILPSIWDERNFDNSVVIEWCFAEEQDVTEDDIIRFFISLDTRNYINRNCNTDELVNIHKEIYTAEYCASLNVRSDLMHAYLLERYFRPFYADLSINELQKLKEFTIKGRVTQDKDTIKYLTFLNRAVLDKNTDENTLLKDYHSDNYYSFSFVESFPIKLLKNKEFKNYIMNLSLKDLRKIYCKIKENTPVDDAVETAEKIMQYSDAVDDINVLDIDDVVYKIKGIVDSPSMIIKTLNTVRLLDEPHTDTRIKFKYFKNLPYIDSEVFKSINSAFYPHKIIEKGCTDEYLNKLLDRLCELMSDIEVAELIMEVHNTQKTLTLEEWNIYINNYDEYKDLPANIWIELV